MKTNKYIQFWSILLVFLTVFGVGNAWGDSVTFDATSDLGENSTNGQAASSDAVTKGVITVTSSNGPMGNGANYRVYTSGTLTISGATITGITVTCTANGNSNYGPQKLSGSGYTGNSDKTGVWSGSSTTVTLSATAQVRITQIVITYTPADPSTVTFNAEGGTCGTSSSTEASGGAGVTLPAASPSASCSSEGWAFYGWATARCASSTTTAPAIVGKAGDTYKPAADITLHAVYYQLIGGTSTATFNPSTLTGLTKLSTNTYRPAQYVHDASNIELYIKDYGIYSSSWDIDNTVNAGDGWGYIKSPHKIQSVAITVKSGYAVDHIAESDAGSAALSTSGTSQTITCSGEVFTIYLYAANSSESQMTTFTVTYYPANYYSNPSCCDKAVAVSYNSAGSTHVSAMTFSETSQPTCSGTAGDREVTIYVTPSSGYLFKAGDELTWTKSSGTIPNDPTLVSGPTLNAGKYEFVYRFAQDDNGAGTFSATASAYTNYRTTCCNTPTLAFGASPYAVLREDIHGASTSTWAEVDVTFTSNSSGTISAGIPYQLAASKWQVYETTGGSACVAAHATFEILTQPAGVTPGTGKFRVKTTSGQTGQGTYRIAITQAATDVDHGNYCETTVYGFVDVTLRDKFVDKLNDNGTVNKDGHGAQLATPALSEFGTQVEDACHEEGRKLKGWIKETDLKTLYENGSPASTRVQTLDGLCESCSSASDEKSRVVAPGTNVTMSGATWYAVWAYER